MDGRYSELRTTLGGNYESMTESNEDKEDRQPVEGIDLRTKMEAMQAELDAAKREITEMKKAEKRRQKNNIDYTTSTNLNLAGAYTDGDIRLDIIELSKAKEQGDLNKGTYDELTSEYSSVLDMEPGKAREEAKKDVADKISNKVQQLRYLRQLAHQDNGQSGQGGGDRYGDSSQSGGGRHKRSKRRRKSTKRRKSKRKTKRKTKRR